VLCDRVGDRVDRRPRIIIVVIFRLRGRLEDRAPPLSRRRRSRNAASSPSVSVVRTGAAQLAASAAARSNRSAESRAAPP